MVTARVLRGALFASLALLAVPHTAQALTWSACPDFSGVRCATVTVPLDRTGADPGQVPLRVARIGKTSGKTLMYLSGGPGGAGVSEMVNVIPVVPALMRRYRVIGYDQRGTGRSGLLRCPALERDPHLRNTAAAEQCANTLGVARKHYTTPDSVQDMEAIRQQLGVDKLTLFGISYGTELALAYARTFPTHVDRLIIDSVVDPDDADPFVTASFRAMTPTLENLCPARCRGISADPVGDLYALVKRLRAHEMIGLAFDAKGRGHKVTIGPTALMDLMFNADYDPPLRAAIPSAVRSALAGDAAPLARLLREGNVFNDLGSPRDFSTARYATICEETPLPWDAGTPLDQRPAIARQRIAALGPDAFKPFDAAVVFEDEIDLCLRWPDVPRPPSGVAPPPYPTVPTLLLQGGEDLRTPPEISARIAAKIPGSKRLVVPGVGHGVTGSDPTGCADRALVRFVDGGAVPTSCRRVPTFVPGVLYGPASFDALPGFGHLPRRIGRTLRALEATFDDLRLVTSPATLTNSGGGLRGGSWALRARRFSLRGYTVVRGVTLTGGGTAHLVVHVSGSKAAHGTVTLSTGGKLRGTLGGRRISVTLGTSARASKVPARASRLTR
jgi:pimeloyl-ACP methyl ester carboxylesterase